MKKTSKILSVILASALALSVTGCSSKPAETAAAATEAATTAEATAAKETEAASAGDTYKIGVIQLVQHSALTFPMKVLLQLWMMQVFLMK